MDVYLTSRDIQRLGLTADPNAKECVVVDPVTCSIRAENPNVWDGTNRLIHTGSDGAAHFARKFVMPTPLHFEHSEAYLETVFQDGTIAPGKRIPPPIRMCDTRHKNPGPGQQVYRPSQKLKDAMEVHNVQTRGRAHVRDFKRHSDMAGIAERIEEGRDAQAPPMRARESALEDLLGAAARNQTGDSRERPAF